MRSGARWKESSKKSKRNEEAARRLRRTTGSGRIDPCLESQLQGEQRDSEAVERIRRQVTDDAIGALNSAAGEAITTVLAVMRGTAACGACGRPATADRDKLKAGEMILARVAGLESGERREVTARIASDPGADARLILQEAALILEERGLLDLAVAVRAESRR